MHLGLWYRYFPLNLVFSGKICLFAVSIDLS